MLPASRAAPAQLVAAVGLSHRPQTAPGGWPRCRPALFSPDTHLRSLESWGAALPWEAHQAALHHVCLRAQHHQGWHPGDPLEVPKSSPSPPCQGAGCGCLLERVPGSTRHLPWALGGRGGPASHLCPSHKEKRWSIKGTAEGNGAEPAPARLTLAPMGLPREPPSHQRRTERGQRGDTVPVWAHLLAPVALLTPVALGKGGSGRSRSCPQAQGRVSPSP